MQIQNIWLDTFAQGVKTKFSGRELRMGCIATSHTSRVHTVFTQWKKELQKNTPQHCVVTRTSYGVYDIDIYSMLAESDCLPTFTDVSCWTSERDGNGLTENLFKAWNNWWTDKCLQAGLLHTQICLNEETNPTALTGWDGLKTHAFLGKAISETSPTPSKQRQKYFFFST